MPGAAGGPYRVTHWEILNEVEGEHSDSPQDYVKIYDAVVAGIRKFAPTGSRDLKFVGLALISDSDFSYASFFLNASNHAPGIPLDVMSYHFYAGFKGATRDGGDHGETYETFFGEADAFLADSEQFIQIRDAISPGTLLDADELGVILPDGTYHGGPPRHAYTHTNAHAHASAEPLTQQLSPPAQTTTSSGHRPRQDFRWCTGMPQRASMATSSPASRPWASTSWA